MRMPYPNELCHYGIYGMKWGIRRYQNPDGTLTAAGKARYSGESGQAKYEKDTARQKASDARKEAKTQKYKASEMKRFERENKMYNRKFSRMNKRLLRAEEKTRERNEEFGSNDPKTLKANEREEKRRAKLLAAESIREFERSKIASMDYTQMVKEIKAMGAARRQAALITAFGMAAAGTTGVGFFALPDSRAAQFNARVSREDAARIMRESRDAARSGEGRDTIERRRQSGAYG